MAKLSCDRSKPGVCVVVVFVMYHTVREGKVSARENSGYAD